MTALPRETEVVIVGSGATGSALAAHLSEAGHQVLILEAGPARSLNDLTSSALWGRRLKWGGTPVIESGDTPISHHFNSGYGTGGGALHHYAVWPRLHAADFRMRSDHDRGLDWPLSYDDLRPHYDAVQAEVGLSGDASQEIWRPPGADYPMPPSPVFPQGELIRRGFAKLGRATAPLPLAVTTTEYRGRRACIWDGWCEAGCPIGALANPLVVHLPRALAKGTQLINHATVVRINTTADGARVTGVDYVDAAGVRHTINARLVILAAFTVENPRLLLASATDRHPNGLGNSSGMLGRYVTRHSAGLVYGLMPEPTYPHLGTIGGQLVNQDQYPKLGHENKAAFGSYQWIIANAVKPNDLLGISTTRPDLTGQALHDFMARAAGHFAKMTAVVEGLPLADNRVTLSDHKDVFGLPQAAVVHNADPASTALWLDALEDGKKIMAAAGATEVWTGPPGGMHIMGGTVMGKDARTSVTNSYGQSHDIPNLFVAGPGLFPTSGGVNPTYTAVALAHRTGEYLQASFASITS